MRVRRASLWIPLGLAVLAVAAAVWAALIRPVAAKDGSLVGQGTASVVAGPDAPYRYAVLSPARRPRLTVVARIMRDGGRIDRWWNLRGDWAIPAGSYGRGGAGLAADEGTLLLTAVDRGDPRRRPALTRFAVLDTRAHLRHPVRDGATRPDHAFHRITLSGRFEALAVSPDGSSAYLGQRSPQPTPERPLAGSGFRVRELDLATGRLDPEPLRNRDGRHLPLAGTPIARTADAAGRWSYALYIDERNHTFLLGIDTLAGTLARVDVPRERLGRSPFGARLLIGDGGRRLVVSKPGFGDRSATLASISLPIATGDEPQPLDPDFLAFTQTPRRPGNVVMRAGVAGRTAAGRPVRVRQLGDPSRVGELVVFECLAGEPCDAGHLQPNSNGCPDPDADIYVVPSQVPESDLDVAGQIVRKLTPAATVWIHQSGRPTGVRAWGESVPAARRLAQRAGLRFRLEPVRAGSAEEWLARDMPRSARISVDLPAGPAPDRLRMRLNTALAHLGREVSEDGDEPRKG
ncbi:MAG: hypothetical protein R2725_13815 [Solirubrobacterales bacterium]